MTDGRPRLQLTTDDTVGHPALDTAISRILLERVDRGELPATLRLSRPARIVAFSSRDARAPGYADAVAATTAAGFSPVVRLAGGRAAVFTESTIAFALSVPTEQPRTGIAARFEALSACLVEAFASLGASARVGEVAGEYCPGAYSVNLGGRRKVAGVGQRLLRRAAHTGGVVVVDDAPLLNRVLVPVYDAMDVPFDPDATGALSDEVDVGFEQVRTAIAEAFARRFDVTPWRLDERTRRLAETAAAEHLVELRPVAS